MPVSEVGLDLAKKISEELVRMGCTVHRYDAFTTSSIYLKVDWGAGLSIRIADHNGYKHLKYRYNIGPKWKGISERTERSQEGYLLRRRFYGSEQWMRLVDDVMKERTKRALKWGGWHAYQQKMNWYRAKALGERRGFWGNKSTVEVKLECPSK